MNILLLGSGGREHALAWKIAQSNKLKKLYIAPGNAGTANCGTNISISVNDFEVIKKTVRELHIDMVVVGPEAPLVKGIYDFFLADDLKHIPVIGPSKLGAQLEGSKYFAKKFMERHGIPTARYKSFTKETLTDGFLFLETSVSPPYVLKADGLAAGKGVVILDNLEDAKKELHEMLINTKFGDASKEVVIEEFLAGIELSVFVLTDGKSYKILPTAKDYKRIGEGDTGANTGGMGAVSPVPFADAPFMKKVENSIIVPTINGLEKDGIVYNGFIFFGLINVNGNPFVIEYNCRMGDPETEVVIPRIKSDLLDLLEGVANQTLSEKSLKTDERTATTVMLVSGGYPDKYENGKIINGLTEVKDSIVFHAGTAFLQSSLPNSQSQIITNGGRVIAITSFGNDMQDALKKSYSNAEKINFEKKYFRKDIGFDLKEKINV